MNKLVGTSYLVFEADAARSLGCPRLTDEPAHSVIREYIQSQSKICDLGSRVLAVMERLTNLTPCYYEMLGFLELGF